jgi:DNA-binding NtrC family response regulator
MAVRFLVLREGSSALDDLSNLIGLNLNCKYFDRASFHQRLTEAGGADAIVILATGPSAGALQLFEWVKSQSIAIPTLAILPGDPDADVLQAAAESVDDFVLWPVRSGEWRYRIHRLLGARTADDTRQTAGRIIEEMALARLIGRAPEFVKTLSRIPAVARSGSPVLITGETGTGKELCARAVHHLGPRRRHPFIPVDCGALPDHLFENEVFGHARGAFTDARSDQRGLVMMADGGTLFLDEVDALPLPAQAKLLRFLQEHTFKPLGSDRFFRADVNVLAATNRDLDALVREKRFRPDLYFRLNVLSLHLAPLRSRRADVPLLARHFVAVICAEQNVPRKTLSALAVRALSLHDWPGNVRELYNVIQRAVLSAEGITILREDVAPHVGQPAEDDRLQGSFGQARARAVEAFERDFVEELLRRHAGNVTRAAREAQKDRRAFGRLVKKYGLSRKAS